LELQRGRELVGRQRADQRRPHGVVEHRGQESTLDRPHRVGELGPGLETYPYGPGLRVDVLEPPTEGDGGGWGRYPAGDGVPEWTHAFSHADVVPARSDNFRRSEGMALVVRLVRLG